MTENWNVGVNLGFSSGIDGLTSASLPDAFGIVRAKLQQSAINSDIFSQVFGDKANTAEIQSVRTQWAIGDFSQLPSVQILSAADMNGAFGAYDKIANTIYLSANNTSVLGAAGVWTEEIGHYLDRFGEDTKGDEGEKFRDSVFGYVRSDTELSRINTEDDRGFIRVNGQSVEVEMAAVSASANSLQTAQNIGVLGSSSQIFTGSVGGSVNENYLKLQVITPVVLKADLSGLTRNVNIRLFNEQGSVLQGSYNTGSATDSVSRTLSAGIYYLNMYRERTGEVGVALPGADVTNYSLNLSATSSIILPPNTNPVSTAPPSSPPSVGVAIPTAFVRVTSPNGGNSVVRGGVTNITYQDNIAENVRIDLHKGGSFYRNITASTASTGSFAWLVPSDVVANDQSGVANWVSLGSDYTIRVQSVASSSIFDSSDRNFSITGKASYDLLGGLSFSPSTAVAGNSITYRYSARNNGSDATGAFGVGYYLSTDANITTSDLFLGESQVAGLAAKGNLELSVSLALPKAGSSFLSGDKTYYIGAIADYKNVIAETNETNNANQALRSDYSAIALTGTAPVPLDYAGNTLGSARNIFANQSFTDFVGDADSNDFYKLSGGTPSRLNLTLGQLSANADIQVIQDFNKNGLVDANEILEFSNLGGNALESINVLVGAGDTYIRVYQGATGANTNYSLSVSANPLTDILVADKTPNSNTFFGTGVTRSFINSVGASNYQSQFGSFLMYGAIADYYTNNQYKNQLNFGLYSSQANTNGLFGIYSGLGLATSPIYKQADGSFLMDFEGGKLTSRNGMVTPSYNSRATGFALVGQGAPNNAELAWKNLYSYWNKGSVGDPTSAVRKINGGWIQEFTGSSKGDGDSVLFMRDGQSSPQPYRVQGGILNIYRSLGGFDLSNPLGLPAVSNGMITEQAGVNGYKVYQAFERGFIGATYDNRIEIKNYQGQFINVIGYDESTISQTYRDTFNRFGGANALGTLLNNVHSWGSGSIQDFDGGSEGRGGIMKSNANNNSFWVGGDFWNAYLAVSGALGLLKYATSDRYNTSNGAVRQDFEGGAIIKSGAGIFSLYGAIGSQYLKVEGAENGRLGLPTSGEVNIGNGQVVQSFEKGRIVWNGTSARTEIYGLPTPPKNPVIESVDEKYAWRASIFQWDRNAGSVPPANFYDGGSNNSNYLGTLNLGSNNVNGNQSGSVRFNWGNSSAAFNSNLPSDGFAIRAYTWADFDGSSYSFTVRGDDGYQILAKNQATGEWIYVTPKDQWQTAGYGVQSTFTAKLPTGRYDLHFHYFENGGEAKMDMSWNKGTTSNPANGGSSLSGSVITNVNIRPSASTTSSPVGKLSASQSVTVDAYTYGGSYLAPNNTTNNLWYRIAGTNNWVAGAYITGISTSNLPQISSTQNPASGGSSGGSPGPSAPTGNTTPKGGSGVASGGSGMSGGSGVASGGSGSNTGGTSSAVNNVNTSYTTIFSLNNQSLGLSGNSNLTKLGGNLSGTVKPNPWNTPAGDFSLGLDYKAELFASAGTFDTQFSSGFNLSYNGSAKAGTTMAVTFNSNLSSNAYLRTDLGVSAALGLKAFVKFDSKTIVPSINAEIGGTLDASDSLNNLLNSKGIPFGVDLGLSGYTNFLNETALKVNDDAFQYINIPLALAWGTGAIAAAATSATGVGASLLPSVKLAIDKAARALKDWEDKYGFAAKAGLTAKQETSLHIEGFEIDVDNQPNNGNEITIGAKGGSGVLNFTIPQTASGSYSFNPFIRPKIRLETTINLGLKLEAGLEDKKLKDYLNGTLNQLPTWSSFAKPYASNLINNTSLAQFKIAGEVSTSDLYSKSVKSFNGVQVASAPKINFSII